MSFWSFLNQWWNFPYLVMLGLVAVFFVIQAFGFATHGDAEVDHELELDHDLEHDFDAPGNTDADADVDHDAEADHDADQETGSLLGAARVPFMVRWLTLFIFSGFSGIFVNRVLQVKAGTYPAWLFAPSLLLSLTVGVLAVRFVSKGVAKLVDTGGRGAPRRAELEGAVGIVASPKLDQSFGEVRVRDGRGNELIVHGHLGPDEKALEQGSKVVLVELDQHSGLFQVAALKE